MQSFDVVIIGAGAAGLFCAGVAGQLGLKVLIIDHSEKVAEKIRISGGGRCNFTNRDTSASNFLGDNPNFCRSALARYTPQDFIALLQKHGVAWHEKHKGQLFCDHSAEDVIRLLLAECDAGSVTRWQPCRIQSIAFSGASPCGSSLGSYEISIDRGQVQAEAVVVATGGLSIPKIGASDLGYRIARQFELPVIAPRPALVPLTFDAAAWAPFAELAPTPQGPMHMLQVQGHRIDFGFLQQKIEMLQARLTQGSGHHNLGLNQGGRGNQLDLAGLKNLKESLGLGLSQQNRHQGRCIHHHQLGSPSSP